MKVLYWILIGFLVLLTHLYSCQSSIKEQYKDWKVYGGSTDNIKYSGLTQIDTSNVRDLEVAWVYQSEHRGSVSFGQMECNPMIIAGTLYGGSPE